MKYIDVVFAANHPEHEAGLVYAEVEEWCGIWGDDIGAFALSIGTDAEIVFLGGGARAIAQGSRLFIALRVLLTGGATKAQFDAMQTWLFRRREQSRLGDLFAGESGLALNWWAYRYNPEQFSF